MLHRDDALQGTELQDQLCVRLSPSAAVCNRCTLTAVPYIAFRAATMIYSLTASSRHLCCILQPSRSSSSKKKHPGTEKAQGFIHKKLAKFEKTAESPNKTASEETPGDK